MIPSTRAFPAIVALAAAALAGCGGGGDEGPTEPENRPPDVTIDEPATGSTFDEGETVTFEGSAVDPDQGTLGGDALVWSSDLDGRLGTGTTLDAPALSAGDHEITLEATDAEGATDSDQISLAIVSDTPSERADLRPSGFAVLPGGALDDETVAVVGRVRNAGGADAGGFDWTITLDGTEVASGRVDSLAAGDSTDLPRTTDLGPFAPGTATARLEVDTGDEVDEASEADNVAEDLLAVYSRGMEIVLRFITEPTDAQRQAFEDAADRWEGLLPGDLRTIRPDSFDTSQCVEGGPTLTEEIDDLEIVVRLDSIDGEGSVLGRAGPCGIRTSPPRTVAVGIMEFDTADIENVRRDGQLDQLVLHEMGHVLGLGTLWGDRGLVADTATDDPFYVGRQGREAFLDVDGDVYDGDHVPVEGFGGEGTALGHWRETELEDELMTGFLNDGDNPLSVLSVDAMGDLKYATDRSGADAYTFPAARSGVGLRIGPGGGGWEERIDAPLFGIDPETGRVRMIRPAGRP